jgi:4-amino-4-deoxy-L-arabinose transferase-like glycosyltransferase
MATVLAIGIFCVRLGEPNLRGEEPRRGLVAIEMLQTGDFLAPRQQGTLFLSRPPLQNWLIAFAGAVRGHVDAVAIRLPSAVATILTVCLIYFYCRSFLSSVGALTASVSYATCGQVLELGKMGETEAIFVLFVAGSLLIWHHGFSYGWPAWRVWSAAYVLVAIGMLTKGLQAPMYFAGSVGLYLLVTQRWRFALSVPHAVGVALCFALWGAWQIPYYFEHGLESSIRIYSNDVGLRFSDTSWATIFTHLAVYPLELLGCLLPWSGLLAVYLFPGFWKTLGSARQPMLFVLCCLAVAFPTCWLVPGAKGRYFMPLYPCFSVLVGLALQRCWEADGSYFWHGTWKRFATLLAVLMIGLSSTLATATWMAPASQLAQPPAFAVAFLALSTLTATVVFLARSSDSESRRRWGVVAVAVFLGVAYSGSYINHLESRSNDTAAHIAELRRQLPGDARLVSLGLINHLFSYYYVDPIKPIERPQADELLRGDAEYFCVSHSLAHSPPPAEMFDFAWEPIATIVCDRYHRDPPRNVVLVGRVIREANPTLRTAAKERSEN